MTELILMAVLSLNTSMTLMPNDLGYLSDEQVTSFRADCKTRGLTSFEIHTTDGKVRNIKCYLETWDMDKPS
jgi:hypothetical protein